MPRVFYPDWWKIWQLFTPFFVLVFSSDQSFRMKFPCNFQSVFPSFFILYFVTFGGIVWKSVRKKSSFSIKKSQFSVDLGLKNAIFFKKSPKIGLKFVKNHLFFSKTASAGEGKFLRKMPINRGFLPLFTPSILAIFQ